ncbi:hypothetical protein HXP44_28445 [Streptomyces sioyaensis]|uniref:Nuclear transport factor 2 family protein n=1 Tax=Streptomyces sioyaensis TaxID=67364 RepID=A0A4Q1QVP7_9ACTN|nr:hypothetical protein [Streptomyces sioyaensis]MBM4795878.1 hypothetical protein [Streptomyces sioyaensis]RXS67282.1 hypothetical protein EST54_12650 [Streptomyces sioyaensis]
MVQTVRRRLVRAAVVVALTGAGALFGVVQPAGAAAPAVTATAPAAVAHPAAAPAQQPQPAPVDVVKAYFAAINNDESEAAWALGGKNISGRPYDSFVTATQGTDQNVVSVGSVVGNKVTVTFDVTLIDGSHQRFTGTYTVQDGVIVTADVRRV